MKEKTGVSLPEGEISFIALHIHSGKTNKTLSEVNRHSRLVSDLVEMVEGQFDIEINKDSIDYKRLVRHLRFAIERVILGEKVVETRKNNFPLERGISGVL